MSVINPNETAKSWRTNKREAAVQAYLSGAEGDVGDLVGARIGGFPFHLSIVPLTDWIQPDELDSGAVAVIQVDGDTPASVKRFERLAKSTSVPLLAAAYEPPLALVRSLMKSGARDVLPLPLDRADLEAALALLGGEVEAKSDAGSVQENRVVAVIKSVGGAGATAVLGQLAIRFATAEAKQGREACLLDLDVQFGNAAFQLGLRPNATVQDLLEAGSRLDRELLRSIAVRHESGLAVISAPSEMMPLDSISSDNLLTLVEFCGREFGTVFVDLPANWTNWSLSLLARSDLVLLLTDLTVTGLQRSRRQLDLMRSQQLDLLDVRVVANRFEKSMLRTIKPSDVRHALGRDVAYTIANEPSVMHAALEQGVPISEIRRKSAIAKDLDSLDAGIAAALGLER